MIRVSIIALGALLIFSACGRRDDSRLPIARLDDETLTLQDAVAEMDTTRGISDAHIREYIQQWFEDQMLYREALQRGFDSDSTVLRRLSQVRRRLVIQAYLDREVYEPAAVDVPEDSLRSLFERQKNVFQLSADAALINLTLFADRDSATAFRNSIIEGASWTQARKRFTNALLYWADSLSVSEATLTPPELWRIAAGFKLQQPSFPVSTADGYYVLIVWKFKPKGSAPEYSDVRDALRNAFIVERRKQKYDSLLAVLRQKHTLEVLPQNARMYFQSAPEQQ